MLKRLLSFLLLALFAASPAFATPASVIAARVWPAADYTRITLEVSKPVANNMFMLNNPGRLVLDLDDVDLGPALKTLSDKILASDPYIKQVRVGNFKPGVVRLVIDLKTEIKPQIFSLPPAGSYKNRLVIDIYPAQDPLMAMLAQREKAAEAPTATAPAAAATQNPPTQAEVVPLPVPASQEPKLKIEPLPKTYTQPEPEPVAEPAKPAETSKPQAEAAAKPAESEKPDVQASESAASQKPEPQKLEPVEQQYIKDQGNGRLITIAIDAGHGGEDPGARGANGSHEKDITLRIAKKLKAAVDADPAMRGILTRDGDYFIPLHGRVVKARKLQSDLFVSIHADAFTKPDARGSSVFALSERGATSASARYLAKHENESDLIGGVSLDDKDPYLARTLLDLSQTATINDSLKLAKHVLNYIGEVNSLHKGSVEQAGFAVLKSPDIPSILVETAFISNPEEERRLNDDAYQDKLVSAILGGIKKYFASNPPLAKSKIARE